MKPLKMPQYKVFKPKIELPNLPRCEISYPGEDYWSQWPTNHKKVSKAKIKEGRFKRLPVKQGIKIRQYLQRFMQTSQRVLE